MVQSINQHKTAPFIHSGHSTAYRYLFTSLALAPVLLAFVYYLGIFILLNVVVAVFLSIILEIVCLLINKADWRFHIKDGHAMLTGLMIGLMAGPDTGFLFITTACVFAIVVAKHAYGGLGKYIFHPAMAGIAFAYLCFPSEFADINTQTYQWLPFLWLLGGTFLWQQKIIHWQIPIAGIMGLLTIDISFQLLQIELYYASAYIPLSGYTLFCLFFLATDSTCTPSSNSEKWFYGLLTGAILYIMYLYSDSVTSIAATILIMNVVSLLIEYLGEYKRQTSA